MTVRKTTKQRKAAEVQPPVVVENVTEEVINSIEEVNNIPDVQESTALSKRDIIAIVCCIICSLLCSLLTYLLLCCNYPNLQPKALEVSTAAINKFVEVADVSSEAECVVYNGSGLADTCEYYIRDGKLRMLFTEAGQYTVVVLSPKRNDIEVQCGIINAGTTDPLPAPPDVVPNPQPGDPLSVYKQTITEGAKIYIPKNTSNKETKAIGENMIRIGNNAKNYDSIESMFSDLKEADESVISGGKKGANYDPKYESKWYSFLGTNGVMDNAINVYLETAYPNLNIDDAVPVLGKLLVVTGTILKDLDK